MKVHDIWCSQKEWSKGHPKFCKIMNLFPKILRKYQRDVTSCWQVTCLNQNPLTDSVMNENGWKYKIILMSKSC